MVISELYHAAKRFQTNLEWLVEAKFFEKVDSTQKRIVQFLPKTGEGAVLIMSETQSKGTGRNGRKWESPVGGIWMTLALPMTGRDASKMASFSVVAALIVVNALKEVNNLKCQVKWPNDILCDGKKLGGIIASTTKKYKKDWFLLGIGINVNNDIPKDLANVATSIQKVRGQSQGRSRLIEAVVDALWTAWQEYHQTGFGAYHKGFETVLAMVGKKTKIQAGTKNFEGTIDGIDHYGSLLLKTGSDVKAVNAGEIVV